MAGKRRADEDASWPNQMPGKARAAPDGDRAATTSAGRDGVLVGDANDALPNAVPVRQQGEARQRDQGRSDGGRNALTARIRELWYSRHNPVRRQMPQQVTGMPSRPMNLRDNPNEQNSLALQRQELASQEPQMRMPEHHGVLGRGNCDHIPSPALAGLNKDTGDRDRPDGQQFLQDPLNVLNAQQHKTNASSSSQMVQQSSGHWPQFYIVSYEDYHQGWNLLNETIRDRDQLRSENEVLKKKIDQVERREAEWACDVWEQQGQIARARDKEWPSLSPDQIKDRVADAQQLHSGAAPHSDEVSLMCRICQVRRASVTLQPCHHRNLCTICYEERRLICPYCNSFAW